MIPSGEGLHYLAVITLLTLVTGVMSKHDGDFYYLNCLHSFPTENKHESHKEVCENKDFCKEDTKKLEFNQKSKYQ